MNRIGWVLAVILVIVLLILAVRSDNAIRFNPDFRSTSTAPYGSKAMVDWLRDEAGSKVQISTKPLRTVVDSTHDPVTLIIASDLFDPDSADVDAIDTLLKRGSTIIVSSAFIGFDLLSRYGIRHDIGIDNETSIRLASNPDVALTDSTRIPGLHQSFDEFQPDTADEYENPDREPDGDTLHADLLNAEVIHKHGKYEWRGILVTNQSDTPIVAATARVYAGRLVVSTMPQLFTNYGMLYHRLWNATEVVLSYAPLQTVIWDDYYKPRSVQQEQQHRLELIGQYKGLTLAYWILLGGLVVYLLVGAKRRQRPIPSIPAVKNTAMELVDNVTALYWLKKDNCAVAQRIAGQVRKYVVHRLRLSWTTNTAALVSSVAASTGAPIDVVQRMISLCMIEIPADLSDEALLRIGEDATRFFRTEI